MIDWFLAHWDEIARVSFWVVLAGFGTLVVLGIRRRSRAWLFLAGALVPSLVFFLAFQPVIADLGETGFYLAVIGFWSSVPALAYSWIVGRGYGLSLALVSSALATIPIAFYLVAYPPLRSALIIPLLFILAAGAVYWLLERPHQTKTRASE